MKKHSKNDPQGGFTLIELMIVVAIVAVLAAVAMPAYSDYVIKARVANALTSAESLRTAIATCGQEAGNVFTGCVTGATGIPDFTPTKEVSAASVSAGGVISMTFAANIGSGIDGKVIKMTPNSSSGVSNVAWSIDASNVTNAVVNSMLTKNNQ